MRGRARSESDRYIREIERRDAIDFARARTPSYPSHPFRVPPRDPRGNGGPAEHTWEETPYSDESTRELAARYVNGSADVAARLAFGELPEPVDCERCGITFLTLRDTDVLCHLCASEPVCPAPVGCVCSDGLEAMGPDAVDCLACPRCSP